MGWITTCDDPLYTDDQAFRVGANEYGPHAYVAPAPGLDMLTTDAAFSAPRLAALVFVKHSANAMPAPYTALRLVVGINCVYLHFNAGEFTAYMLPPPGGGSCAASIAPDEAYALRVTTVLNPAPWNAPPETNAAANIPAVARFHEAHVSRGATPYTLIGVRCGSKWCELWPLQSSERQPPAHAGRHPERRGWSVNGWNDAQHLAMQNGAGVISRGTLEASIMPVDNLASQTFPAPTGEHPGDAQHAATIYFESRPRGVYKDEWHFRKHANELYIWKDPGSSTGWSGEIQNTSLFGFITHHIPVNVEPRHVGTNPPATARFRWSADDEDVWVKCDGCCYVSRKT